MHAALAGQQPERILAGDGEGRRLDARLFAVLVVVHLGFEALLFGPAQVHAHQHLGPVLASVPPAPGCTVTMAFSGSVSPESMVRNSSWSTWSRRLVDLALEIGSNRFAFPSQLEIGFNVAGAPLQLGIVGQLPSIRFRSRMIGCDSAGFDHSAGSASLVSMAASSVRRRGASKILPQTADFFADGSVSKFKIGEHD